MMKKAVLCIAVALTIVACSTNPAVKTAATGHAEAIRNVALGQTMYEVRSIMKADPETRTRRLLADGRNQEDWGYVTDYGNDVITQVSFTDRKVTEIRQTAWRGEYVKNSIAPGEDLRSADDLAAEANARRVLQANIDNASEVVKIGATSADVRRLLGEPLSVNAYQSFRNVTSVDQTFHRSDGRVIVVTIRADKVASVSGPK
jgi:hypothetical protein